jgi:hypothetical protein
MKPPDTAAGRPDSAPAKAPTDGGDGIPGVPLIRTWTGVYIFVLGSFLLWVALLTVLTRTFS